MSRGNLRSRGRRRGDLLAGKKNVFCVLVEETMTHPEPRHTLRRQRSGRHSFRLRPRLLTPDYFVHAEERRGSGSRTLVCTGGAARWRSNRGVTGVGSRLPAVIRTRVRVFSTHAPSKQPLDRMIYTFTASACAAVSARTAALTCTRRSAIIVSELITNNRGGNNNNSNTRD